MDDKTSLIPITIILACAFIGCVVLTWKAEVVSDAINGLYESIRSVRIGRDLRPRRSNPANLGIFFTSGEPADIRLFGVVGIVISGFMLLILGAILVAG